MLGVIDIDMHDRAVFTKLLNLAGYAIIKAHSDREKEVRLVRRIIGINSAMHSQPFESQGMVLRKPADSHESRCDGNLRSLSEFC